MVQVAASSSSILGRCRDTQKSKLAALSPEVAEIFEVILLVNFVSEWSQLLLSKVEDCLTKLQVVSSDKIEIFRYVIFPKLTAD
jgi:hypothetical protein